MYNAKKTRNEKSSVLNSLKTALKAVNNIDPVLKRTLLVIDLQRLFTCHD